MTYDAWKTKEPEVYEDPPPAVDPRDEAYTQACEEIDRLKKINTEAMEEIDRLKAIIERFERAAVKPERQYENVPFHYRKPLDDGEGLIYSLPGMIIQPGRYPFDFVFNGRLRIEVKSALKPSIIPYDWGETLQFKWGMGRHSGQNIRPADFDGQV